MMPDIVCVIIMAECKQKIIAPLKGCCANEDGLIVMVKLAFCMAVDKPDIRWMDHMDLPKSIESYY